MRNITLSKNIPYTLPEITDIVDQLPKKAKWSEIPKKKWNVRGHWDGKTYLTGFRKPEDITRIIVHHAGSNGTLTAHANYHAKKWGAGIAYHIAIDKGRIYQLNDLLDMTYHAGGNNTDSISIMVNRDLSGNELTEEERKLLYAAILTVKSLFSITELIGHRECCPTLCPVTDMNIIRQDIARIESEQKLNESLQETDNAKIAQVYAAFTRFSDLYKLASKENPNQAEAIRKCLLIADMMVEQGILKR